MAALLPYLPAIISAVSSIGSSFAKRGSQDETSVQGSQRELIDQILSSLKGDGPFSDMFETDDASFQKSYVDPAKQMFRDQIAPTIQGAYTGGAYGQQRASSTGVQDSLSRAGIDLDQMLNQQYSKFQDKGNNRKMDMMSKILNQSKGSNQGTQSFGGTALEGLAGFLSGDSSKNGLNTIFDQLNKKPKDGNKPPEDIEPLAKGFES